MRPFPRQHPAVDYAITSVHSVPDDAWYLELDLAARQCNLATAIVPVRAHMEATGALRAWAARTVDTASPETTVATTAFLLDASIPTAPDPSLTPGATKEELFAAYVAHSAHHVERDGLPYPVLLDVYVVRPSEESPLRRSPQESGTFAGQASRVTRARTSAAMFHASSSPRWWRPSRGRSAMRRAGHAGLFAEPVGIGEHGLGIGVGAVRRVPEGVGDPVGLALPGELPAVVIAPAGPGAYPGLVLVGEVPACLGEGDALVHLCLRQAGQCGAEAAHRRPGRADQDAVAGHAPAGRHVHDGEADLDDLVDGPGRRLSVPAGGFHVDM